MRFQKVKEGKVEFFVPIEEKLTKKVCVFYNPVMKFDRDLSEIIISILKGMVFNHKIKKHTHSC
ncbi:MAG TPA: hypothetical protein EYP80_00430 [Candidatus Aenigmarchaeota archaeon]|nr:hypothetical protein [Candidatus Aenigmarchaeota archaeon]